MRSVAFAIAFASLLNACMPPKSKNTYQQNGETWACFLDTGKVEVKASESALPSCTKLSDFAPADQETIVAAAQSNEVIAPGTFQIIRAGL